jgi:hypothetical protein
MMPSDQKLHASRQTETSGLLFADDRVAFKIETLVTIQSPAGPDVIAVHHDLAHVVNKGSLLHKKAVVSGEIKLLSDGVGQFSDTEAVGVLISLECVHFGGNFEQLFVKTSFRGYDTWHKDSFRLMAASFKRRRCRRCRLQFLPLFAGSTNKSKSYRIE